MCRPWVRNPAHFLNLFQLQGSWLFKPAIDLRKLREAGLAHLRPADRLPARCSHRPAQGWVRRLADRMLEDGRLAGGDAMRRVQTDRMDGHEGRIKQDALLRGGRSSPLHNLNQDRRALWSALLGFCRVAWTEARLAQHWPRSAFSMMVLEMSHPHGWAA